MEDILNILITLLVLAGIVVTIVKRPIAPKISRWLLAHRVLVQRVAPFVFFAWGGGIWVLILIKGDFSNLIAMVAATAIFLTGVLFLVKRF
ncbi:MAG TPA: hypothetical protein VGQ41_20970 [Pyrinomonadaceae bacterium]|jgi:hypothetical protein|nr:hypothetical protein [Pyrinomonadaceae bacterium]